MKGLGMSKHLVHRRFSIDTLDNPYNVEIAGWGGRIDGLKPKVDAETKQLFPPYKSI